MIKNPSHVSQDNIKVDIIGISNTLRISSTNPYH